MTAEERKQRKVDQIAMWLSGKTPEEIAKAFSVKKRTVFANIREYMNGDGKDNPECITRMNMYENAVINKCICSRLMPPGFEDQWNEARFRILNAGGRS